MVKGLYVAATALVTNTHKIDAISNNLANVNSSGFKKDRVLVESFNDRLFSRINGTDYPYMNTAPDVTMTQTGDDYTLKTSGGYFRVQTDEGIHYDNEVKVIVDTDGYVRTVYKNIGGTNDSLKGNLLLGENGSIYAGSGPLSVDAEGNLSVDGTLVDKIAITTLPNVVGTMGAGIKAYKIATDYSSGQLEVTNSKFDVALEGEGFFNIATPQGTFYSRDGAFTRNQYDELVTMDGMTVVGLDGAIQITSDDFYINEFGEVIQDGEITDKLTITNFSNVGDLKKIGGTFFKFSDNPTGEMVEFEGSVKQGVLEHSNVDAITEMIGLIELNRNYESNQKVVTTIDELLGKAVNELGSV